MILRLLSVSGTLMRYAGPLALSKPTLTRFIVSSALSALAVTRLGAALLSATGLWARQA